MSFIKRLWCHRCRVEVWHRASWLPERRWSVWLCQDCTSMRVD